MKKNAKPLTASELFEKLQQEKPLSPTNSNGIVGMVKKADGRDKAIQFSPGKNCSDWVTIPLQAIMNVTVLGSISCKDHSHPQVELFLKPDVASAKMLWSLLTAFNSALIHAAGNSLMDRVVSHCWTEGNYVFCTSCSSQGKGCTTEIVGYANAF